MASTDPVVPIFGGPKAAAISNHVVRVMSEYTGRTVIAFMSDNHLEPDMAIEAFVLAPTDAEPAPA